MRELHFGHKQAARCSREWIDRKCTCFACVCDLILHKTSTSTKAWDLVAQPLPLGGGEGVSAAAHISGYPLAFKPVHCRAVLCCALLSEPSATAHASLLCVPHFFILAASSGMMTLQSCAVLCAAVRAVCYRPFQLALCSPFFQSSGKFKHDDIAELCCAVRCCRSRLLPPIPACFVFPISSF